MNNNALAKIPRILWQTHRFAPSDLPHYISACTDSWGELNPEFDYRYVSESQTYEQVSLIQDGRFKYIYEYPYMSKVTRADIWRLLILQEFGGIYIDCDMVCLKPILNFINLRKEFAIDTVNAQHMWFSDDVSNHFGNPELQFAVLNGIIASSPNNKFITSCTDSLEELCLKAIKNDEIIGPDITGPAMLTFCLNKLLQDNQDLINGFQPATNPLFDGSLLDMNGAFLWNDRTDRHSFNNIGNMFDKFIDRNDASSMPQGGGIPVNDEHESSFYRGFEKLEIKFFKRGSHYS